MLHPLGLEHLVHAVRAARERVCDITTAVGGFRERVALEVDDGILGVVQRREGVRQGTERAVVDIDQGRGLSGGSPGVSDHDGQHVTEI